MKSDSTVYPGRSPLWELLNEQAPEHAEFFLLCKDAFGAKFIDITFDRDFADDSDHLGSADIKPYDKVCRCLFRHYCYSRLMLCR